MIFRGARWVSPGRIDEPAPVQSEIGQVTADGSPGDHDPAGGQIMGYPSR